MAVYDTYREAVLANGSTKGVMFARNCLTGEEFFRSSIDFDYELQCPNFDEALWVKCNPADHLETLESFLASGKRLVKGDSLILLTGYVAIIEYDEEEAAPTYKSDMNSERFVLHSAADQMETPEEKEAFDSIPNQTTIDSMNSEAEKESYNSASEAFDAIEATLQQVESLGKWIPKSGQTVYIAQINTLAGVKEERYFVVQFWCNSKHQREYLDCGILFPTKEEAEIKTKTMLGIPIETPAEREGRERNEAIDEMMNFTQRGVYSAIQRDLCAKLYDAGYRKQ